MEKKCEPGNLPEAECVVWERKRTLHYLGSCYAGLVPPTISFTLYSHACEAGIILTIIWKRNM